ncbi:heavy-metal-associated domain-containing protein [Acidocella aminolytica]|nr:heavy-metal-associated domain-containing protein [Acidocella aminolytica]
MELGVNSSCRQKLFQFRWRLAMLEFKVGGMTCGHCVRAVTNAVHTVVPGADVAVDLNHGVVKIDGDLATIPTEAVIKAIEDEGYKIH